MRIRIRHFTLLRIRIRPFALTRIRIRFRIKVLRICNHWHYTDLTRLHFEPPRLHCERQRPSKAFILSLLSSWILTSMQIRIRLWSVPGCSFSLMRIWIRILLSKSDADASVSGSTTLGEVNRTFSTYNVRLHTMIGVACYWQPAARNITAGAQIHTTS